MDHVHASVKRAVAALLLVLVCFGAGQARADAPMTMYRASYSNYTTKWVTTAAAACLQMNNNPAGWGGYTWSSDGGEGCNMKNGTQLIYSIQTQRGSGCADGSNPDTTKPTASQCAAPPPSCTDASMVNKYVGAWVEGSGAAPGYACIQGCQYPQGSTAVGFPSSYGMSLSKGNGQTCTGANYDRIDTTTKPIDPPTPASCGLKGEVYGTVNGIGGCWKGGEIPNTTLTHTDTKTSTTTDASGVQAAPQTTNTTTNVTNVNGVSTVTRTTTNPDGSKKTETEPKDSFCAKNADDAVCKVSDSDASGGADCKTPPVCKGDAIQCAMLNQQWRTRCDDNQESVYSALGQKLLDGADPVSNPASAGQREVKNVSSSIDQSTFLAGGGLQDKYVTVSGHSIALPFSKLNQYLTWLGHIFVVISLIGAIRIVLGGFK